MIGGQKIRIPINLIYKFNNESLNSFVIIFIYSEINFIKIFLLVSDVTTTSSSLSDSTGSNHTNSSTTPTSTQSLTNLLHLNATETTLLGQEKGEYDIQTNEQQQSLPIFQ